MADDFPSLRVASVRSLGRLANQQWTISRKSACKFPIADLPISISAISISLRDIEFLYPIVTKPTILVETGVAGLTTWTCELGGQGSAERSLVRR